MLNNLVSAVISFVVIAIVMAVGLSLLTGLQATQTPDSLAANSTGLAITGVGTFGTYLPILALAIVGAVVIGVVYGLFQGQGQKA